MLPVSRSLTSRSSQTELPNTAPDIGGLLKIKSAAPLKPAKPQAPCDAGLFSDQANQRELFE
jgi:hypothetical protein